MRSQQARLITLSGFLALLLLMVLWQLVLYPSESYPWLGMLFVIPLLFPLQGIIKGKIYTHAWTSLMILFYFVHGVGETFASPDERIWAMLEILFSVQVYTGAILYTRLRSREKRAEKHPQG